MDNVLYFVGSAIRETVRATEEALEAAGRRISPLRARTIRIGVETSAPRALAKLRAGAVDALLVDARGEVGGLEGSTCLGILRALFAEHEVGRVIGREKTWLVVGPDQAGAALAFEAGRMHLGGILVAEREASGWDAIWEGLVATVSRGRGGKIALCLAGGGTEGLLYELGVLRALERFLPGKRTDGAGFGLPDVDIICGISAGAILGGLLANGLDAEAIRTGLKSGSDRLMPLDRRDLFDPNFGELFRRAARLSVEVARGHRSPVSALFRLPPAGVFAGVRLRQWLRTQFERPGMVDRFDALPHKLFIGSTDQDTNEHVVFGADGAPQVPIHIAIRASTALAPFYAPEQIGGRYYIDGGFTRTTNMRVAVNEGATLVVLVDPLVPISSRRAGHVAERGAIYVAMQGLKSLINGRFDKAVPTLRAMYPHVAFHLFQPGEDARRVMAGSPMKYFYREEIAEIAYRETLRDIRVGRLSALTRDFARHGVTFRDPESRPSANGLADLRVVA